MQNGAALEIFSATYQLTHPTIVNRRELAATLLESTVVRFATMRKFIAATVDAIRNSVRTDY